MQSHAHSASASCPPRCAGALLALLVTGCSRTTPTTNPNNLPNGGGDRAQKSPYAAPRNTLVQELQGALQACREVQASRGIPIGCAVDVVEDVPAMVVSFGSVDDATSYQNIVAKHLAVPFCRATSSVELAAAFVVVIAEQTATVFDCQSGRNRTHALRAIESPIERAVRTCEAMNQTDLPLDCKMMNIEATPALALAFGTVQLMNEYFAPATELIIEPFCAATTEARDPGSVLVIIGDNAKTYRCDQKSWSPWSPFREFGREQTPSARAGHRVANVAKSEI